MRVFFPSSLDIEGLAGNKIGDFNSMSKGPVRKQRGRNKKEGGGEGIASSLSISEACVLSSFLKRLMSSCCCYLPRLLQVRFSSQEEKEEKKTTKKKEYILAQRGYNADICKKEGMTYFSVF